MTVEIHLTDAQLREWIAEFPETVRKAMESAIPQIESIARTLTPAPDSTGELKDSIQVTKESYGLKVAWTAPYAQWVEENVPAHWIHARGGGYLKFMDSRTGEIIFRKWVHVRGHPGRFFKERVREVVMPLLRGIVEMQVQAISRGF